MFETNNTTIVCIDIQEKLLAAVQNAAFVKSNAIKILKAAAILDMDVIITEQYPKGLGSTVEEIKAIKDFKTIEKTTFSAYKTEECKNEIKRLKNKNIILFGLENHICVLQTALELKEKGYNVSVLADCSSCRNLLNFEASLELMKQKGIDIITVEIALFELIKSSKHPKFKEIQGLIK